MAGQTKAERRREAGKHAAVGGAIVGGSIAADSAIENYMDRRKIKRPGAALMQRKLKRVHGPLMAGKGAVWAARATGLPLLAYGAYNVARPKQNVKQLDVTRDVIKPAWDTVTLRQGKAIQEARERLSKTMDAPLPARERRDLIRRKDIGRKLSEVGGVLGLTSLALRGPAGAKFLAARSPKGAIRTRLKRASKFEPRATSMSTALVPVALGTGALGSFNYAAQQKLEAKAVKKSKHFSTKTPLGAGLAGLAIAAGAGAGTGGVYLVGDRLVRLRKTGRQKASKSFPYPGQKTDVPASQMNERERTLLRQRLERGGPKLKPLPERGKRQNLTPEQWAERKAKFAGRSHAARQHAFEQRPVAAAAQEAAVERKAVKPPRQKKHPAMHPSQVGALAARGAVGAGGVTALAARGAQRRRGENPAGGKAVDAAIGGAAGYAVADAASIGGDWSVKVLARRYREKQTKNPEVRRRVNEAMSEHRRKIGIQQIGTRHKGDRKDALDPKVQAKWGMKYPKSVPGWQAQRYLGHMSRPAVGPIIGGGGALVGAGLAVANAHRNERKGKVGKSWVGSGWKPASQMSTAERVVVRNGKLHRSAARRNSELEPPPPPSPRPHPREGGLRHLNGRTHTPVRVVGYVGGGKFKVVGPDDAYREAKPGKNPGDLFFKKADDAFLRQYRQNISPSAEQGYTTLRRDRNVASGMAAGNAAMAGLVGAHTVRNLKGSKLSTAVGGTWTVLSTAQAAEQARRARGLERRMGKIRAKGRERAAAGELGPERVGKATGRDLGETAAGAGLIGVALGHNKIADSAHRFVRDMGQAKFESRTKHLSNVYGVDAKNRPVNHPVPRQPGESLKDAMKRKRTGQAAAKRRQGLINEAERKRNKVTRIGRSISGPRVREALTVGGLVAGVPLAWHGARGMVDKREAPSRGDVDAAAAGALAGGLGYQGAMYATKPVDAALRRKVDKDPKAKARLNRHARKMKIDSTDPGAMDRYKQFNRTYPKSVPGWQWRRAMSHLHGGKTGVGLTLASAGAGAAGGVAWKRRHDSGVAKGLLQPPKFNYARSIGAGLRARKPRAGGVRLTPTGRQVTFRGSVR